jgi:hypothetical protein
MQNKKLNSSHLCVFNRYHSFYYLIFTLIIFLSPFYALAKGLNAEEIFVLTNAERDKAGIKRLVPNRLLTEAAEKKAQAIFKTNSFGHSIDGKKFSDWIRAAGYKYDYAGENLAINYFDSNDAMAAWMQSESHKKNILNPEFEDIGVAVLEGKFKDADTILAVQEFGTSKKDKKKKKPVEIPSIPPVSTLPNLSLIALTTSVNSNGLLISPLDVSLIAGTSYQSEITLPNTFFIQHQASEKRAPNTDKLSAFCYILALGYSYKIGRKASPDIPS